MTRCSTHFDGLFLNLKKPKKQKAKQNCVQLERTEQYCEQDLFPKKIFSCRRHLTHFVGPPPLAGPLGGGAATNLNFLFFLFFLFYFSFFSLFLFCFFFLLHCGV